MLCLTCSRDVYTKTLQLLFFHSLRSSELKTSALCPVDDKWNYNFGRRLPSLATSHLTKKVVARGQPKLPVLPAIQLPQSPPGLASIGQVVWLHFLPAHTKLFFVN